MSRAAVKPSRRRGQMLEIAEHIHVIEGELRRYLQDYAPRVQRTRDLMRARWSANGWRAVQGTPIFALAVAVERLGIIDEVAEKMLSAIQPAREHFPMARRSRSPARRAAHRIANVIDLAERAARRRGEG
jgi:hypothetical protein